MGRLPLAVLLALLARPLHAIETRLGIGAFSLFGGIDLQVQVRRDGSPWLVGWRYLDHTEELSVGFQGVINETRTVKTGPMVNYLFSPQERGSWYVGAGVLRWRQEEYSNRTGTRGQASTTGAVFGGGYSGVAGGAFHYHWGLFIGRGSLTTRTADSETYNKGNVDPQLIIGVAF